MVLVAQLFLQSYHFTKKFFFSFLGLSPRAIPEVCQFDSEFWEKKVDRLTPAHAPLTRRCSDDIAGNDQFHAAVLLPA